MRFFLFALLACSPIAAQPLIELASPTLQASELATVVPAFAQASPRLEIARAPLPGVTRRVTRLELSRWARQAGIDVQPDELPESIRLTRLQRRLSAAEAEEAIRDATAARFHVVGEQVSVEIEDFIEPLIPAGDLELTLAGSVRRLNAPQRLSLRWTEAGGRSGVEPVRAVVRVRGRYLTPLRQLAAGDSTLPGDFEIVDADLPDVPGTTLLTDPQKSPALVRCALARGDAVPARCLSERALVERGAVLELILEVGGVRLRAPARAQGEGSKGDLIPVRNLATNRRVLARVVSAEVARPVEAVP